MLKSFWNWYERNYVANVGIAAFLFSLQIVHLIWLAGFVVYARLFGHPLFVFTGIWESLVVLVDYAEIPAILTTSLVFIFKLRQQFNFKDLIMLVLLNSQWLHLFWITDEFVLEGLTGQMVSLPVWLAWIAILIDYLELPVIYQTFRELFQAIRVRDLTRIRASFKD